MAKTEHSAVEALGCALTKQGTVCPADGERAGVSDMAPSGWRRDGAMSSVRRSR